MEPHPRQLVVNKEEKNGFTFLEMLLVLLVMSIMTFIILPVGSKWIQTTSEEDALQAFIVAIQNVQAYSMANHVGTRVMIVNSGKTYVASVPGVKDFSRTDFPKGMEVSSSSQMQEVKFHANGDIVKFGTMSLKTSFGIIELRFQIQRGRITVHRFGG